MQTILYYQNLTTNYDGHFCALRKKWASFGGTSIPRARNLSAFLAASNLNFPILFCSALEWRSLVWSVNPDSLPIGLSGSMVFQMSRNISISLFMTVLRFAWKDNFCLRISMINNRAYIISKTMMRMCSDIVCKANTASRSQRYSPAKWLPPARLALTSREISRITRWKGAYVIMKSSAVAADW